MITFDTAQEWQEWFDTTFPAGARVTSMAGAWEVVPRVEVHGMSDGYVSVVCGAWNYDRQWRGRFKGISAEDSSSYAYTQYVVQDPAEGSVRVIFSGDVASADAAEIAAQRKRSMEALED